MKKNFFLTTTPQPERFFVFKQVISCLSPWSSHLNLSWFWLFKYLFFLLGSIELPPPPSKKLKEFKSVSFWCCCFSFSWDNGNLSVSNHILKKIFNYSPCLLIVRFLFPSGTPIIWISALCKSTSIHFMSWLISYIQCMFLEPASWFTQSNFLLCWFFYYCF